METKLVKYKLGDIATFSYGKMPKKELIGTGRYVVYSGYKYLDSYPEMNTSVGDLIVVARGVGGTGDVKIASRDCYLTNLSIKINLNKEIIRNDYFYYIHLHNNLRYLDSGSAQSQITINDLEKVEIFIPSLCIQDSIISQLKCIDKKISLNNATNQTLEQMSQTLFKSWFVDFDPVIDNALDAGNDIPEPLRARSELRQKVRKHIDLKPLPTEIRALFPVEFEETELGWIPTGWKFENVNSLLKNTIGGDWGKDVPDDKHTVQATIVRGTDIPELLTGKQSSAPKRWVEPKKLEKRKIEAGDIIIEVSGGSPTQSTGRSIFMSSQIIERLGGVVEPASFCRKFSPLTIEVGLLLSLHFKKIYNDGKMWEYQNQSTGIANFQTAYFLENEHMVVAEESVVSEFYRIIFPWIKKNHSNEQINLTNLRDTLLPKLISGELSLEDLPELIKQTEAA